MQLSMAQGKAVNVWVEYSGGWVELYARLPPKLMSIRH